MYERRSQPLLTRAQFFQRVLQHALFACGILVASLGLGVLGYHGFENLPWLDALLNASMILGGMGPVDPLKSNEGKLFASFYALFSGIIFLGAAGILVAPIVHRVLHQLHLDPDERDQGAPASDESESSLESAGSTRESPPQSPARRD
jgi:hypothetical protein